MDRGSSQVSQGADHGSKMVREGCCEGGGCEVTQVRVH